MNTLTSGALAKCGTEIDYQVITYQVAMREILPRLVFSCPITKLALEAVKKEAAQDIQLGTTDQRIVIKPESVVTLNNRNYSMFVAKEKGIDLEDTSRRELLGHMFDTKKTAELQKRYQSRRPEYGCAAATTNKNGRSWRVGVCLITY
ncbi:unnamed protein product [Heligmosomoides polygyrus]|uniref:DNA-directed RNA polymerase n=1 Tax=Heligmosomoides polygyrus TaxID=6339 RepID=A0A183G2N6_HELPZ|nr:unnamed protein product [Heligmosomoides polygyrus]